MAILSNINGKFAVDSTGAVQFSGAAGTSGYILKSNGTGSAPTWVDPDTIVGPYLPLSGGTLTGATATASGISFTFGGTAQFDGDMTLPAAADNFDIGFNLSTTGKIRFGHTSWNNSLGLESYWMVLRTNQNEGLKLIDSAGNTYVQLNASNNSAGAYKSTFTGDIATAADKRISVGTWDNSGFTGGNAYGFSVTSSLPLLHLTESDQTSKKGYIGLSGGNMYVGGLITDLYFQTGASGTVGLTVDSNQNTIVAGPFWIQEYIYHHGDANTYIRALSDEWVFRTGGDDRFTISNTNTYFTSTNVGIGTTSPDRSLDVQEALSIFGSGGTTEIMLRGQVEGTGTVRNVGSWHWSIRSDIGGDNDDLKLVRFITGSYAGIAMQVQNSTGDIFFGNTVVNPASGFSNQKGLGYDNSTGNLQVASTSGTAMTIGRNESSDGQILELRKESNVKHSFGSTTSYLLGSVGIGITNPSAALDVNGSSALFMTRASAGLATYIENDGGYAALYMYQLGGGQKVKIHTNNTSFFNGGNVGIGTTSPAQPLSVHGNFLVRTTNVDGNKNRMQCIVGGSSDAANLYLYYGNSGDGTVSVRINAQGDSYLNGGNIGIGTTSPGGALHVYSGTSERFLITGDVHVQGATDFNINGTNRRINFTSGNGTIRTTGAGSVIFGTNSTERMRILSSGYIGMNEIPSGFATLEIKNISSTTYGLYVEYTDTSASYGGMKVILSGASTSPSYVDWWYGATQTGAVVTTGSSTQYLTSSDYRLKENIVPMSNAIDRVMQLKPSRFNFIGHENIVDGLIAHEVAEVVPEAVNGEKDGLRDDGTPKYQGIDEGKLVPLLIGAIQELEARVKELENK